MAADIADTQQLVIQETGTGRAVLVLHGGGGPDTVRPIAAHLADTHRVLLPTLPGWNGTPRPEAMTTISDYAHAYLGHLAGLGLRDVVAIGSSLGGWIAAEMAAHDTSGVLGAVVLVDGAGITVEDEPIHRPARRRPHRLRARAVHRGGRPATRRRRVAGRGPRR